MVHQRVRIRFTKQGDLRLVGHRDLARGFERWFRRAELKLRMSEGFHPKPRISFPSALAVGIAGTDEVMELELVELYADELSRRLAGCAPPGLSILAIEVLPPQAPKARVCGFRYEVPLPAARREGLSDRIEQLLSAATWPLKRPNRQTTVDLRELLDEITLQEGVLRMRLRVEGQSSAGPRDVLAALGLDDLEQEDGVCLTRTAVELQS